MREGMVLELHTDVRTRPPSPCGRASLSADPWCESPRLLDAWEAKRLRLRCKAVRVAVVGAVHVVHASMRKVVVLVLGARDAARPATGRVALAPSAASILGRLLMRIATPVKLVPNDVRSRRRKVSPTAVTAHLIMSGATRFALFAIASVAGGDALPTKAAEAV